MFQSMTQSRKLPHVNANVQSRYLRCNYERYVAHHTAVMALRKPDQLDLESPGLLNVPHSQIHAL